MPKPDADPHGGAKDFEKVENPYCDIPDIKDDLKKGVCRRDDLKS